MRTGSRASTELRLDGPGFHLPNQSLSINGRVAVLSPEEVWDGSSERTAVRGEGHITMVEVVSALIADFDGIGGIFCRTRNGGIIQCGSVPRSPSSPLFAAGLRRYESGGRSTPVPHRHTRAGSSSACAQVSSFRSTAYSTRSTRHRTESPNACRSRCSV